MMPEVPKLTLVPTRAECDVLRPLLRSDVQCRPIDEEVICATVATGAAFDGAAVEMTAVEWRIAQLMDGTRSLEDLVGLASSIGLSWQPSDVRSLCERLGLGRLLVSADVAVSLGKPETAVLAGAIMGGAPIEENTVSRTSENCADEAPVVELAAHRPSSADLARDAKRIVRTRLLRRLVLVSAALVILGFCPYPLYVTERCVVVPSQRQLLRAQLAGVLIEITHDEGDRVTRGEILARIDDRELLARKSILTAKKDVLNWELLALQHGARREEIKRERLAVRTKSTEVTFAEKRAKRVETMVESQVGSQESLENAERDVAIRQRELSEEEARLALLRSSARPEVLAAKTAEIAQVEADLLLVTHQLELSVIRSPFDGIITTPHFREKLHEGLRLGDLICEVVDGHNMRVDVFVPEREMDAVNPGEPVQVKVHAFPQQRFRGMVNFVSAAAEADASDGRVVRTVAQVDNHELLLREGMTGYAEINAGRRTVLSLAMRRVVRWIRVRFLI
jgi:multidrug resistance efflux pump